MDASTNQQVDIHGIIILYKLLHITKYFILNPFKPNGMSPSYQFDQSISILKVVGYFYF